GQGQAQGQGGGQGQGQGQGQRSGGPSGRIGGTNSATAPGATGGAGTPNGTGHNASVDIQKATVFEPITGSNGEHLNATGQRDLVRSVVVAVLCEGHVLLEGVPGLGKTQLLKTLAEAVELEISRIQFTPDLMPADIVGTSVLEEGEDGRRHFRFGAGPIFA